MQKETSIKRTLQKMMPPPGSICEGVVIAADPLAIQVINNPKMVAAGMTLAVPQHLTDYETTCTVALEVGDQLSGETEAGQKLKSIKLTKAPITIHGALAVGEVVLMMGINNGSKYVVIDRKG